MGVMPLSTGERAVDRWQAVEAALARLATHCEADGTVIVPRGLAQRGADTGGVRARPVDLRPYRAIRHWAVEDLVVSVEAGATLAELNERLAARRQWVPVGMPDTADDTVGGLLAMGLEGLWRAAYGRLADRVLAVSAWVPAFGVVRLGAPVVKNVAGYNLPRLFLGTEAAFGVLLEVTLKVAPRPPAIASWETPVAEAQDAVSVIDALSRLGWWSFLGVRRDQNGWAVVACLAGSEEQVVHRGRHLGSPVVEGAVWTSSGRFPENRTWVSGAVARRHRLAVLEWIAAHDGYGWIDWESGGAWLQIPDHTVEKLVGRGAAWDGALRPSQRRWAQASSPSPVLERLKAALDPRQVLPPLGVEEAASDGA